MTTERTYRCDLCHESIKPEGTAGVKCGTGIYWAGKQIQLKPYLNDAEHHLCFECIKAVSEAYIDGRKI